MRRVIGIDIHRTFGEVVIWDRGVLRHAGRVDMTRTGLEGLGKALQATDEVVIEATGNCMAVARVLSPFVAQVVIAHAHVQTDKVDAGTLASLYAAGFLPEIWTPDPRTERLRRLTARRYQVVRQLTRIKNEVHAILHAHLIPKCPHADLFNGRGRAWLSRQPVPDDERAAIERHFCGCGTTIYSVVKNERKWIGCDIAILSIKLIRETLTGDDFRLVEGKHFDVNGIPVSVEQAEELFKRDPFQFEHWLVEKIGSFPTKKTGDRGIDGRMYFETREGLKAMVLSVKGGNVRPTDVRDLRGVLEREHDTAMAGFLSLKPASKAMLEEAASAGQYEYAGVKYNRLQLLTVREIWEEKREFHTPTKMGSRIATGQQSLPL